MKTLAKREEVEDKKEENVSNMQNISKEAGLSPQMS